MPLSKRTIPQAKMMADAGFRSVVAPLHADHVRTDPPRPVVDAGGRLRPAADRRGQPDEPAFHPREQPFEGNRRPAGVGCEPVARGQRGDRRDHFAHAGRRPTRARRRGRRNPRAECIGCRSFTFRESHRYRLPVGVHRGSRSRRHGTRARGAHSVVQLARPSEKRDPIGDPWRNGQPRRSRPTPRLYRGADRVGNGSVERGGSAGPQSGAGHGGLSGLSAGPCSVRTNLGAVEQIPGLAGSPGIQREAVEGPRAPAGSSGRRSGQQCALER